MTEVDPTETSRAWSALTAHRDARADVTLRELFAGDDDRGERLATKIGYSIRTWSFADSLAMVTL